MRPPSFEKWGEVDGPHRSWRSTISESIFLMTEPELWNPYKNISVAAYNVFKDIVPRPSYRLEMKGYDLQQKIGKLIFVRSRVVCVWVWVGGCPTPF